MFIHVYLLRRKELVTHFQNPLGSVTTQAVRLCLAITKTANESLPLTQLHDIFLGFYAFEPFHTCCNLITNFILKARVQFMLRLLKVELFVFISVVRSSFVSPANRYGNYYCKFEATSE